MRRIFNIRIAWIAIVLTCLESGSFKGAAFAQRDALASWNAGPAKQAITAFVAAVTKQGSADVVPPAERIATFDHDGTLWAEQSMYFQIMFAMDRVRALAPKHPDWKTKQPFKAVLDGDLKALAALGETGFLKIMPLTHWIVTARHPRFNRLYTELVYQPMLELLSFLRANSFKIFIVSGGGVEFMRVFTERVYGIPPEQLVGSSGVVKFQLLPDGKPVLLKTAQIEFVDDGPGKPAGISRFISRRPVFAFGNSDGDQQMLEWTAAGTGARFMGLVHHTDAEREWAYDRKSAIGRLDKALNEAKAKNWIVVDMRNDWKRIFPFEP